MTQLAQSAPAAPTTLPRSRLNDAARAGSLVTSRTVFTRALADILAGEDPDPGTRQASLMMGQACAAQADQRDADRSRQRPSRRARLRCGRVPGHKIFWKVDVYANDGTFAWGSETPWDAQQSFRVVTDHAGERLVTR
jgi:hypothetical protein